MEIVVRRNKDVVFIHPCIHLIENRVHNSNNIHRIVHFINTCVISNMQYTTPIYMYVYMYIHCYEY